MKLVEVLFLVESSNYITVHLHVATSGQSPFPNNNQRVSTTRVQRREPYDIRSSFLPSDCGSRLRDVRAPFDDMIDETPLTKSTTLEDDLHIFSQDYEARIESERRTLIRLIPTLTGKYDKPLSELAKMLEEQRSVYKKPKTNNTTPQVRSKVKKQVHVLDKMKIDPPKSLDSAVSVQEQWRFSQTIITRSRDEFDEQNNHNGSLLHGESTVFNGFTTSVTGSSSTIGMNERKRKADEMDDLTEAESNPTTTTRTTN